MNRSKKTLRGKVLRTCLAVGLIFGRRALSGRDVSCFTVRNSIEMAKFSGTGTTIEFSPHGRYFFSMTTRGLIESNQIETTLWLFDTSLIARSIQHPRESVAPRPLVRMSSSSNEDTITMARWSTNGQRILFIGQNGASERHLFDVNIRDGRLRQLSPNGKDVSAFDQNDSGLVFTTTPPVRDSELYESGGPDLPDVQIGTGLSLFGLLYPKWEPSTFGLWPQQLWTVRGGRTLPVFNSETAMSISVNNNRFISVLSLSPSGRFAVIVNRVRQVPAAWESYEVPLGSSFSHILAGSSEMKPSVDPLWPVQYELVELKTGRLRGIVNAPIGWTAGYGDALKASWSPDEQTLALTNTFLSLTLPTAHGHRAPTRPCVAVVDVHVRSIDCVRETPALDLTGSAHSPRISDVVWQGNDRLILRFDGDSVSHGAPLLFVRREDGNWMSNLVADPSSDVTQARQKWGISITVEESLNVGPVIVAKDEKSGQSREIWNPNPQLANFDTGNASVYRWHDTDGHEWSGGLVKPQGYTPGPRPLVIQTHGFDPGKFLSDGYYSTANAARALACRGIVVLQVGEVSAVPFGVPQEAERNGRAGYQSAIDQLTADGVIDPHKVGIIGFSRTGWYVLDSLIHMPHAFAAATLAEGTYESFGEYLLNADYLGPYRAQTIADGIGTRPFGDGLRQWVANSPGFNTDKIRAPVLFEANNPTGMIYAWDIYAAMRLQSKPVELLYMRSGQHILTKPRELLASQQMNVDWYDFWLNAHEDPDPTKAEQYVRWRELRRLQANPSAQLSTFQTPCLDSGPACFLNADRVGEVPNPADDDKLLRGKPLRAIFVRPAAAGRGRTHFLQRSPGR